MNIIFYIFLFILAIGLNKFFFVIAQNSRLMDKPNERSIHTTPILRGGGIIFIGLLLISLLGLVFFAKYPADELIILFISISVLATISFFDDLYNLSAKSRFLVQCLVALGVSCLIQPHKVDFIVFALASSYIIIPFLFFSVLWAINHFNFMDGIDGFCAIQALFLLVLYGILFSNYNAMMYSNLCFILISGLLGFLIFNFPPAKLFMGDIGSASLGLITFSLALIAQQKYQIPLLYWFVLNGLFLFDATSTLLRRFINKEKWSAAHKKHAYQRLKQYGLETRYILLGQVVINSSFFIGLFLLHFNKLNLPIFLLFFVGIILVLYSVIERLFPMYNNIHLLIPEE